MPLALGMLRAICSGRERTLSDPPPPPSMCITHSHPFVGPTPNDRDSFVGLLRDRAPGAADHGGVPKGIAGVSADPETDPPIGCLAMASAVSDTKLPRLSGAALPLPLAFLCSSSALARLPPLALPSAARVAWIATPTTGLPSYTFSEFPIAQALRCNARANYRPSICGPHAHCGGSASLARSPSSSCPFHVSCEKSHRS